MLSKCHSSLPVTLRSIVCGNRHGGVRLGLNGHRITTITKVHLLRTIFASHLPYFISPQSSLLCDREINMVELLGCLEA